MSFFAGGIGDQQALSTRSRAVAAASRAVVDALEPSVTPHAMGSHNDKTVPLVVGSDGCVLGSVASGPGVTNVTASLLRR